MVVCHSPYGPEEPSTPSCTAYHCPLSVILKMKIKHGGFQWSCHKWLLEVQGRIEPCDTLLKGTDKTFYVYKQYTHMSVQGFSMLTQYCTLVSNTNYFFVIFTVFIKSIIVGVYTLLVCKTGSA